MKQGLVSFSTVTFSLSVVFLLLLLPPIPVRQLSQDYVDSVLTTKAPFQWDWEFNGTRAFTYLKDQCAFGPRPPGSDNLTACGDYIIASLETQGWVVQTQTWLYQGTTLRNIIAGAVTSPRYVLLAHYDTRPIAEMDPDPLNWTKPILGANDGASGVAALLELATVLPEEAKNQVSLLFVDAEDSGNYNDWEWIVGSTYFVNSLTLVQKANIQLAILLDMIGDADLQLKREQSSTPSLVDALWETAVNLQYDDVFLNVPGYTMIDDHRPFLSAGIPAVDIIDFDYPYWHTLADTPEKCSNTSLEAVGRVVEAFIQYKLMLDDLPKWIPSLSVYIVIGVLIMVGGVLILIRYRRIFQRKSA